MKSTPVLTTTPQLANSPDAQLEVWWLNPAWTVVLLAAVLVPASYLIPDWMYREYWRMPKLIDGHVVVLCFLCVAAFAIGAIAGNTRPHGGEAGGRYRWTQDLPWNLWLQAFTWSFYLTVFGYLAWLASAFSRGLTPALMLEALRGVKGAGIVVKNEYLVTISGVTTMTQFGHVVAILGAVIGCTYGWRHVRAKLGWLLVMAVLRAQLNSERLAVIELAIPFTLIVIRLGLLDSPRIATRRLKLLVQAGPVYASVALLALFAVSEYFRSWINFYVDGRLNFFQFVSLRLLGYYVTAINNGALLISSFQPTGAPYFTEHFLWRFPITSSIVQSLYPDLPFLNDDEPYTSILTVGANPEFNNGDGYLIPIIDFGVVGALVYWLVMGLICGWMYRLFCRKHPLGILLYPLLFVGITEMPRVLYWGEGRVIPGLVVLSLLAYVSVQFRSRAQELKSYQLFFGSPVR